LSKKRRVTETALERRRRGMCRNLMIRCSVAIIEPQIQDEQRMVQIEKLGAYEVYLRGYKC
jgi:hypothetical protein